MKIKAFLLSAFLLISLLPGCANTENAQIAATTLPVYQFTQRLCEGTGITVTRLVTESVSCLHDYSLNVQQVKAVEQAVAVIISGAGLEEFMNDVLDNAKAVIDSSVDIALLGCETEHDHDHNLGHHHEQDAHIWLSPSNAKTMASNICEGLVKQFPAHEDTFNNNLSALHAELDDLLAYGEKQLKNLSNRELITFHDGFGYFANAFDLTILEAIEEESGSEASAQELIHLIDIVNEHDLRAIFTEINGSVSAADIIARETGAVAFPLDMAMAGDSYFEAMYHNIDTIKEALG
jgi:zinc transport system substrate-binding protein